MSHIGRPVDSLGVVWLAVLSNQTALGHFLKLRLSNFMSAGIISG
jgi:hypothetical protein